MTTKTPEQIAREALNRYAAIDAQHLTGKNALTIATAAIKADRAQRAFTETDLGDLLSEWEALEVDVDGFYEKWVAKINQREA